MKNPSAPRLLLTIYLRDYYSQYYTKIDNYRGEYRDIYRRHSDVETIVKYWRSVEQKNKDFRFEPRDVQPSYGGQYGSTTMAWPRAFINLIPEMICIPSQGTSELIPSWHSSLFRFQVVSTVKLGHLANPLVGEILS